jgi:hypothetical protein
MFESLGGEGISLKNRRKNERKIIPQHNLSITVTDGVRNFD